ncbi:thiosulfate oxidation carrier complex protein SoxZ [Acidithiobacillus caldus]
MGPSSPQSCAQSSRLLRCNPAYRYSIKPRVAMRFFEPPAGKPLCHLDWSTAISANPYLAFKMRAERSGTLAMTWKDNQGGSWTAEAKITVA